MIDEREPSWIYGVIGTEDQARNAATLVDRLRDLHLVAWNVSNDLGEILNRWPMDGMSARERRLFDKAEDKIREQIGHLVTAVELVGID